MKRLLFVFLTFLVILCFSSCGNNPYVDEDVVGRWSDGDATLTLNGDGSFVISSFGINNTGAYTAENGYITFYPDAEEWSVNSTSYFVNDIYGSKTLNIYGDQLRFVG